MHLLHLSSNKIGEVFATICLTDFGGVVANGKAGAYFPGLDQFRATRLRFRTHQDALDFADHIVQEAIGCRPFITLDEWSNYREGNLGICATIRVRGEAHSMLTGENLVSARDEQTKCVLVERRTQRVIGFTAHLNPEHRKSLKLTE